MITFKQFLKETQDRIKWSEVENLIKNTFGLTPIYYKSKMSYDMVSYKERGNEDISYYPSQGSMGKMFGPCCGHSINCPYLVVTIKGWAYYYDEDGKKWYIVPDGIFDTRDQSENPFPSVATEELDNVSWDLHYQKPPLPGSHVGGGI